jgi:hypothetical protein
MTILMPQRGLLHNRYYHSKFSEFGLASYEPTGWTHRGYRTSNEFCGVYAAGADSKSLGVVAWYSDDLTSIMSCNALDRTRNCDVTLKAQVGIADGSTRGYWGLVLRGLASSGLHGYVVHLERISGAAQISVHNMSSHTTAFRTGTLGTALGTITSGMGVLTDWRWIRVRLVGGNIKVKHWLNGAGEPASWGIDVTDGSPIAGSGWVGWGSGQCFKPGSGNFQVYCDEITIRELG